MNHITLLQDLAIIMCVAAGATILFRHFNQPIVLAYIITGVILGPHTPPFSLIADEGTVETLAELGIIFLMFALGLEFSLRKMRKVGMTAFIAASLEIFLMILAGYGLGLLFGWSQMDSIFLGAILSISSTTIIIKALEGLGKTKERFANLIFGILIVEDILAIILIALLSGLATTGEIAPSDIGVTILYLGAFLGTLLVAGLVLVPRLLNYVARFKNDEVLLIVVVGLCFGVSYITVKLGYSVALGAFLIGAIIAEARQIVKIEALLQPVRDLFSAVFFVSIGLLIDPLLIVQYAVPILIITVVVIIGKVITCSLGTFLTGHSTRTSLRVGMGLAQIGEFSFIIASLGLTHGVTSNFMYPIAVAVSGITTLTTPYFIKSSDDLVKWFDHKAPRFFVKGLDAYSKWATAVHNQHATNLERKILSQLGVQIGINMLLVTGIFIGAVFLHEKTRDMFLRFPGGDNGLKAAIWFVAVLTSFPSLVAIWRKMEVGAMVIAELSSEGHFSSQKALIFRTVVFHLLRALGTLALIITLLLLSSALLPSWNVFLLAVAAATLCAIFFYRASVKLYARVQAVLRDTFEKDAETASIQNQWEGSLPREFFGEAKLETIKIGKEAAGKKIADLNLRAKTGASVLGIERQGKSIVNPSPNEKLEAGDNMLILGNADQLSAVGELLSNPAN